MIKSTVELREIMKLSYQREIYELSKWLDNVNNNASNGFNFMYIMQDVRNVQNWIFTIASAIQDEYPFYAAELPQIAKILFRNGVGAAMLNIAAFGELFIIIKHIKEEPSTTDFWTNVHPQIVVISKELFCDGHYSAAAEKAIKEVEARLREKYVELNLGIPPAKVGAIVAAMFGDNGKFILCDTSTVSGKNYQNGIRQLFDGAMTAYRNPSSHANLPCSKKEALEQIMLASQLMYILDKPQFKA
jgi:uncharacterized protein (TIGR02391 family)